MDIILFLLVMVFSSYVLLCFVFLHLFFDSPFFRVVDVVYLHTSRHCMLLASRLSLSHFLCSCHISDVSQSGRVRKQGLSSEKQQLTIAHVAKQRGGGRTWKI